MVAGTLTPQPKSTASAAESTHLPLRWAIWLYAVRVLAIDLGSVRVGVAISDELGVLAHPRPHLQGGNPAALIAALRDLARAEQVERFLVGLPRSLSGDEGRPAREARRFAEALERQTGIAVELCDEWLSTREAQRRLGEGGSRQKDTRSRIDSAAAAVMLQSWLDARAGAGGR